MEWTDADRDVMTEIIALLDTDADMVTPERVAEHVDQSEEEVWSSMRSFREAGLITCADTDGLLVTDVADEAATLVRSLTRADPSLGTVGLGRHGPRDEHLDRVDDGLETR